MRNQLKYNSATTSNSAPVGEQLKDKLDWVAGLTFRGIRALRAECLDQDVGHFRPHDPLVRAFPALQLLSNFRPAHGDGLLIGVPFGQVDASQRLIEGRKTDLARLYLELAREA